MTPALREIRIAGRSIEGFARFLLAGESDPARRYCLEAIIQGSAEIEEQVRVLAAAEDGADT